MTALAQEHAVVEVRAPAMSAPPFDVVDLARTGRGVAADAAAVTLGECTSLRLREQALLAPPVEDLAVTAQDAGITPPADAIRRAVAALTGWSRPSTRALPRPVISSSSVIRTITVAPRPGTS